MRIFSFSFLLPFVLALFVGCGSAPVKEQSVLSMTQAQIDQVVDYDQLFAMYKNASATLAGKDPAVYAEDFATLNSIGDRLATMRTAQLGILFDDARLSTGQVPLTTLQALKAQADNSVVAKASWQPVLDLIAQELKLSNEAVAENERALASSQLDDELRLVAMDDLYRLTGDESWLDKRNAFVDQLVEEIRQAKSEGRMDPTLQPKIDLVLENRPEDEVLKKELVAFSADIYQADYFQALGNGDADKAYNIFLKMSESKNFEAIKANLADVTTKMADYFAAEADESVKDPANLSQSYRWYSQARTIANKLGVKKKNLPGHKILTKQLNDKYKSLTDNGDHTVALAYLHFIKEFDPRFKSLRQYFNKTEEKVRSLAVKRLSTTAFKGGDQQGYGDIISSKVTQHLFKHIPYDVRIVEREKFEELQRERELGKSLDGLAAVDLLVTGSVLEAKVDTSKQEGKKTVRAVVGKETIPNQAYIKWLEMSARDRKDVEKPSETITIDKEENIPVAETRHRKVGIFSVSYRLVDAQNGRVVFPDSHTEQEEYTGVSQEGVEMGNFKREFKLANLPSDVKILDSLATKVSSAIGERLVDILKDQEQKYLAEAEDYKKDNLCYQHADRLAKALIILEAKGMETEKVFEEYKKATINCDNI